MIILFKYCASVENWESFKNFGFIYIYIQHYANQSSYINNYFINFLKINNKNK